MSSAVAATVDLSWAPTWEDQQQRETPQRETIPGWDDMWVVIPAPVSDAVPVLSRRVREIEAWTGWSDRQVAEVAGATHPTVAAIRKGRGETRPDLADRIAGIHEVVERIYLLSHRDSAEARRLLETSLEHAIRSARESLAMGRFSEAYRAALEARSPRPEGRMMTSRVTRSAAGVVALEDIDDA